ncbi:MAG TPA: serine/threonine-protein kinase [Kofleriaceae bacterium]|nr:serine/threonine-protein kinase [Kofleriaceae bacterium]
MTTHAVCDACDARVEAGAKFCGECGAALAKPAADPSDPFVGLTLNGRFSLEDKLGQGGFGAVYRGTQVATGRRVAVKVLHPDVARDGNLVMRFRREGEVLCQLRDAHTITTYDVDQTADGMLFIAMELLEGKSLYEVLQNEAPVAWARVLRIIAQMCSSLAEAHALGIVHRDLKPENIYLEPRPQDPEFVKILDFGIAKVMSGDGTQPQLTATGQTLGTLEYMSPEQLMGRALTGASDIYSLGVLAYELCTGQLPFPDATGPAELIAAQLQKEPVVPSAACPKAAIPPEVDALILWMLGKTAEARPADAAALLAACEVALTKAGGARGPAVLAPELTPPPELRTPPAPGPITVGATPAHARAAVAGGKGRERVGAETAAALAASSENRLLPWILAVAIVAAAIAAAALALS